MSWPYDHLVRPDYARENPETVRKILRALVRGSEWIARASPQDHLALLKKRFETVDSKVLLDAIANVRAAILPSRCVTPNR